MSADDALKKVWLARSQLGQGNFSEAIRLLVEGDCSPARPFAPDSPRHIAVRWLFVKRPRPGKNRQSVLAFLSASTGKTGERGYLGNVGITDPANQPHYDVAPDGRFLINTVPGRCSRFANYHPAETGSPAK
jgi:hypothetical protein